MGHSSSLTNPHPPCPLPLEPSTSCWRYPESLPWCCLHRGRCRPSATWGFRPGNKPLIRNGTPLIENRKDKGKYMNIWYNMKKTHLSGRCDGRTNYKWCVFFSSESCLITRRYPKYAVKISQIFAHGDFNRNTGMCGMETHQKWGLNNFEVERFFSIQYMRFFIIQLGPKGRLKHCEALSICTLW